MSGIPHFCMSVRIRKTAIYNVLFVVCCLTAGNERILIVNVQFILCPKNVQLFNCFNLLRKCHFGSFVF